MPKSTRESNLATSSLTSRPETFRVNDTTAAADVCRMCVNGSCVRSWSATVSIKRNTYVVQMLLSTFMLKTQQHNTYRVFVRVIFVCVYLPCFSLGASTMVDKEQHSTTQHSTVCVQRDRERKNNRQPEKKFQNLKHDPVRSYLQWYLEWRYTRDTRNENFWEKGLNT